MKVLLLGYSTIAKKRIINTFLKKKISFCVASKSTKNKIQGSYNQFNSYEDGLNKSKADIAYISLPNSLHFYWAKLALTKGYHVIVDKPICLNKSDAKKLIDISKKNKKLLVEAIYFNYHKQFKQAIKIAGGHHKIIHIEANFVIPSPDKKNYRSLKKLGGGALLDMGPYAAAISRIFLKKGITSKTIDIKKNKKKIITSFKILSKNSYKTFSGFFKFGGEYQNELLLHTKNRIIKISRVFSPPENLKLPISVFTDRSQKVYKTNNDNCFENFFLKVLINIKKKKNNVYVKDIIFDSSYIDKITN